MQELFADPTLLVIVAFGLVCTAIVLACMLGKSVYWYIATRRFGCDVAFVDVLAMRIQEVELDEVMAALLRARKEGIVISADDLADHNRMGGDVQRVVSALVLARRKGVPLSWEEATRLDRGGHDVLEVVRIAANGGPSSHEINGSGCGTKRHGTGSSHSRLVCWDRPEARVPAILAMINQDLLLILALVTAVLVVVGFAFWLGPFVKLWIQAHFSDAHVPMSTLIAMRRRGGNVRRMVLTRIRCVKMGEHVPIETIEAYERSGGNAVQVVSAMLLARGGGYTLTWAAATEIQRSGHDVVAAVQRLLADGQSGSRTVSESGSR